MPPLRESEELGPSSVPVRTVATGLESLGYHGEHHRPQMSRRCRCQLRQMDCRPARIVPDQGAYRAALDIQFWVVDTQILAIPGITK